MLPKVPGPLWGCPAFCLAGAAGIDHSRHRACGLGSGLATVQMDMGAHRRAAAAWSPALQQNN